MKKMISSAKGPRAGRLGHFFTSAWLLVYLQTGQFVLANSSEQPVSAPAQATSQELAPVDGSVGAADDTTSKSEEALLTDALRQLKANKLASAVEDLAQLKDEFPDNDDYLLLYRTALRKKNSSDPDSQKWYSYVRNLDKKEAEKHAFLETARDAAGTPAKERINELKRANWLILTTGRNKNVVKKSL